MNIEKLTKKISKRKYCKVYLSDTYCFFNEDFPDFLDSKKYSKILSDFFYELSLKIIRENYIWKMPYKMGKIRIKKSKTPKDQKKRLLNFKIYKETGKKIFYNNLHTDGYHFEWTWIKTWYKYHDFKNRSFYIFKPARGNDYKIGTRGLSAWINKCSKDPLLRDYDALQ